MMSYADGAQEGISMPSCESPRPKGTPLWIPRAYVGDPQGLSEERSSSRGLALERSDRQRFSRGRPFGSYKVGCRSVQGARSVKTAVDVILQIKR